MERDPIVIVVHTDREAAEQRTTDELRRTEGSDCHTVSLPLGWRADYLSVAEECGLLIG
ncbi:hypothetical protein FHR84_000310 [Actinopolyspora biskrensis]|uniref:Uncharacterized protein n=1 Tax=Actinopolyspora biskrensis TaxID=1470178 RepID=A0A852Z014_9ACTN|nr:hypothetical protein [Actinopolyspora biskrensis]NYH76996.1 hypothetical protein [Actinopolyspora biskrensis]